MTNAAASGISREEAGPAGPAPELEPQQVLDTVLAACRRSRGDAARALWAFAGERLRRSVGDRDHLEHLLGNELFGPLVGWRSVEFDAPERLADSLRQMLRVVDDGGLTASYLVAMRRSPYGENAGCWLIGGIERE